MEQPPRKYTQTSHRRYIPDELLLDSVIPKLPTKSACRFKSVSKPWLAAISTPEITALHSPHLPCNQGALIHTESALFTVVNYTAHNRHRTTTAAANTTTTKDKDGMKREKITWNYPSRSCLPFETSNGLVCSMINYNRVNIWNPFTKKCREIEVSEHVGSCSRDVKGGNSLWGFGYAPKLKDYKLVHVCPNSAQVFSLKNDENWREIPTTRLLDLYKNSDSDSAVVLPDGRIHWMLRKYDGNNNKRCTTVVVLGFDTVDESFREVAVPEQLNGDEGKYLRSHACIGTYEDDYLCVVSVDSSKYLHVWVLGRYYGESTSWTKVLKLGRVVAPATEKLRFFASCGGAILMHSGGQAWLICFDEDGGNSKHAQLAHHTYQTRKFNKSNASPLMD